MSDRDIPEAPEGDDMLAAEYVLGTLPLPERLAAGRRLRTDAEFSARVAAWEARLAPLNDNYAEESPPDLFPAIEAKIFGTAAKTPRRGFGWAGFGWRGFAGGVLAALALAALLFALVPVRAPMVATLRGTDQALVIRAAYSPGTGELVLTRVAGPAPDSGHDYELWTVPAVGAPVAQGLVSAEQVRRRMPGLTEGAKLAVTLEPAGGSPDGTPGLLLVSGIVERR